MADRRVAVVTGGSSGIGAATVAALAADGWTVVAVARGQAALHDVRDRIVAAGGDVAAESVDASDGDAMVDMAERVVASAGVPHAIVNAAGAGEWRFIEDTPPQLAVQMMSAPYFAAFNTTHAFMAPMLELRRGVIVSVGSPASFVPWPAATAYVATRWALRGLHEALRQDLLGTGVSSSHVVFGEVASPYFDRNDVGRSDLPYLSKVLRAISPRECAEVILATIARPRPQVIHPPAVRALAAFGRLFPPIGRRVTAWGAPRHT